MNIEVKIFFFYFQKLYELTIRAIEPH